MAIPPIDDAKHLNYDIKTDFLNLAFCSEHFISIKHRILATFNMNSKFNSILTACMPSIYNFIKHCQCWDNICILKKILVKIESMYYYGYLRHIANYWYIVLIPITFMCF